MTQVARQVTQFMGSAVCLVRSPG